jgi:hypothetical protein
MNKIIEVNNSNSNFQINANREELIYTIIDACPYDFELIPTIASFKYLSYFDQINEFKGVRYFYKMYKLIDMLCFYKTLILKYEEQINQKNNISSNSKNTQLTIFCDDKHLFESCQINAIKIYKNSFSACKNSFINDNVLAHSLNHIINEFFEESYSSKLKEKDIKRQIGLKGSFMGVDVWEFNKKY